MADLILKPIGNWVLEGWRNMADLADKIDDLICSFEGTGDTTMDTVAMYMFGWMLFGLFVLCIGKFVYGKYSSINDYKGSKSVVAETSITKSENSVDTSARAIVKEGTVSKSSGTNVGIGGKYVPPTPPIRKRLGSRSGRSGPVKSKLTSYAHPPPLATGPESESVKWVNELFAWLYSDLVIVNELLNVWIQSLNEFTKKSVAEHGVGVEFVRLLGETQSPTLSNVFCECAANDDVTITLDCEATPALQLKVMRQRGEKVEVSHYRANVNKFRSRVSVVAITEKLVADVKCDGWPEVKVSLAQVGSIKNNLDESQLQDVIIEIVTVTLRNSNAHLNLSQYPTCPRLVRYIPTPSHLLPLHYDSMVNQSQYSTVKPTNKRLLVKVVKAVGLGAKLGCTEPFCVVELDDPAQKNQTSIKKDTDSPVWDEHFLFDVSPSTAELMFEVFDRKGGLNGENRFLGLGIVGVEELLINPNQRQIIALQSRPYQQDPISGTLTVEFLFIEGADLPQLGDRPFKLKETLRSVSPSGAMLTTKTVFSTGSERLTNGGDVTDLALKDLKMRNRGTPTQTSKSTLIIHSVQRQPQRQTLKVEMSDTGCWREVPEPSPKFGEGLAGQPINSQPGTQNTAHTENTADGSVMQERGRSRRKKRDFFGTLRRRLNRSRVRSRSEPREYDETQNTNDTLSRSVSADRSREPSAHSTGYLTVPGLREGSTRSSLSEASGISGASSRTYVSEASTLVLETVENGIKNGTVCDVCRKALARRLGKQGYECRDCLFKCHKHCHIRADSTCPNSNIHNLELCSHLQSPYALRKGEKKM